LREGAGRRRSMRRLLRFSRLQRRIVRRHRAGNSEMTSIRVRTSSERLLSCVEVASMVCAIRGAVGGGAVERREGHAEWSGSPDIIERDQTVEHVEARVLDAFAATGAVSCWKLMANARYAAVRVAEAPRGPARAARRARSRRCSRRPRGSALRRPIAQSTCGGPGGGAFGEVGAVDREACDHFGPAPGAARSRCNRECGASRARVRAAGSPPP